MSDRTEPVVSSASVAADDYTPPRVRLFEIEYVDGTIEKFASQHSVSTDGRLIFIDEEYVGPGQVKLLYRQTIAAGQWRKYREISTTLGSQVN